MWVEAMTFAAVMLGCTVFLSIDLKRIARALEAAEEPSHEGSESGAEQGADPKKDLG